MASCEALCVMLVLATSLVGSTSTAAAPPSGLRLELTHVDAAKGKFTRSQLIRRAEHRSRLRAAMLSAAVTDGRGTEASYNSAATTSPTWDTHSRVHWSPNEYLVELAIGTPPVPFVALVDTGSNLIWTQSRPCTHCEYQSTPIYNPFTSRSFSLEPCSSVACRGTPHFYLNSECDNKTRPLRLCRYSYTYGDGAYSRGVLGRETLTFHGNGKPVSVSGIAFGCGNDNKGDMFNGTGTVGLGRGPLSIVAQLGFGKFSYCLTPYHSKRTSPLLFGSLADLSTAGGGLVQTTPLLQVPEHASFYYVTLEGVSIGGTRLPIPKDAFELRSGGDGGVIFDSGSTFTSLPETAFKVIVSYIDDILGKPPSNVSDLQGPCYEIADLREMVLHFADGADMRLHRDNYMLKIVNEEGSVMCLAMSGIRGPSSSIIGNFQQQNMHVLYDITEGYLSFVPADCSSL